MSMVTHRVRGRDPAQKMTHFAGLIRPQNQMPVIRHQLIGKQLNVVVLQTLAQNPFKRPIIGVLVEDLCA